MMREIAKQELTDLIYVCAKALAFVCDMGNPKIFNIYSMEQLIRRCESMMKKLEAL